MSCPIAQQNFSRTPAAPFRQAKQNRFAIAGRGESGFHSRTKPAGNCSTPGHRCTGSGQPALPPTRSNRKPHAAPLPRQRTFFAEKQSIVTLPGRGKGKLPAFWHAIFYTKNRPLDSRPAAQTGGSPGRGLGSRCCPGSISRPAVRYRTASACPRWRVSARQVDPAALSVRAGPPCALQGANVPPGKQRNPKEQ